MLYGGIEAGGTKFNLVVGTGPNDVRAELRIPTTTPRETLDRTVKFFLDYQERTQENIDAYAVGSFGPVDLHPDSPTFGYVTTTPKPGWLMTDVAGPLREALKKTVVFETDVNVAAIGELTWGAGVGLRDLLYVTIGTGIGGGVLVDGKPYHGLVHPEMGHVRLPHDLQKDPFPGSCPFHGDCFEGLANGPAMFNRWGQPGETLPPEHPAWALEAHYIALAVQAFVCTLSPQRVILGGGVMQQAQLFPMIRVEVLALLNGYVQSPVILENIDSYIVPPGLGGKAGMLGAIALAKMAVGDD
jgi:fructokinase